MSNLSKYAIIVAGGSGLRMGGDIPKQFLELCGKPVLMHTLQKFYDALPTISIHLVLPSAQQPYWVALCEKYQFNIKHILVDGGATRFQSVKNGLNSIPETNGLVAIHDGVRPFVSKEIIVASFDVAAKLGNATVAVPSKDSLRVVEKDFNKAVDRSVYRIIQTPQTFKLDLLKKAFTSPELPIFTDDASVFEHAGHTINLIEGSYKNIKITTPEDMLLGEVIFKS